jgi:hypothetical protein
MSVHILTRYYTPRHTIGKWVTPGYSDTIWIAERPWLNNASNVSCIPEDTYIIREYDSTSRGFKCFKLMTEESLEPTPRFGILIHPGNDPLIDSQGCLLPGTMWSSTGVNESRRAFALLKDRIDDGDTVIIKQFDPND